ncbi:MAG: hypothetical protein IPO74_10880 [Thermomonas sp.]|nr:hypothetical protein [Thermomonas sp.]
MTADPGYAALTAEQQGGLLQRFQEAPNAAHDPSTWWPGGLPQLRGPCGAGLAAYEDALKPDGGTFAVDGSTYTIQDGQLLDSEGVVAGSVRTDGTYQLVGEDQPRNYYDDHHARVRLTETEGETTSTLLDLHDADPNGVLTNDGMNDTFTGLATETLRDVRREGIDMRAQSGYRSFTEQDRLYNQGCTTTGKS